MIIHWERVWRRGSVPLTHKHGSDGGLSASLVSNNRRAIAACGGSDWLLPLPINNELTHFPLVVGFSGSRLHICFDSNLVPEFMLPELFKILLYRVHCQRHFRFSGWPDVCLRNFLKHSMA